MGSDRPLIDMTTEESSEAASSGPTTEEQREGGNPFRLTEQDRAEIEIEHGQLALEEDR